MSRNPDYDDYLNSATWMFIRGQAIVRAGGKCEICGRPKYLNVHHKTYARVGGNELPEDLQVVCRRCHRLIHRLPLDSEPFRRKKDWPQGEGGECENVNRKGKKCTIPTANAPVNGLRLCHVHHPEMTFQKQLAARRLERARTKKKKPSKLERRIRAFRQQNAPHVWKPKIHKKLEPFTQDMQTKRRPPTGNAALLS